MGQYSRNINMTEILLISLGAILGANTRFKISNKLENLILNKDYSILIINTFSSFCLGLFLSLLKPFSAIIYSYQLILFFSIGFLGSLSSFSSFVYDLFNLWTLMILKVKILIFYIKMELLYLMEMIMIILMLVMGRLVFYHLNIMSYFICFLIHY